MTATLSGGLLGLVLGFLGQSILGGTSVPSSVTTAAAATLGLGGALIDLEPGRLRLPTIRRQVRQASLRDRRGWYCGMSFGARLGFAVSTIVISSAVYVAFVCAFLIGDAVAGAVIGASFGLLRASTVLGSSRVRTVEGFARIETFLGRWDLPGRRAVAVVQGLAALAVIVFLSLTL